MGAGFGSAPYYLELDFPHPTKHKLASKPAIEFMAADIETGFVLVDKAKASCAHTELFVVLQRISSQLLKGAPTSI